MWKLHTQTLDWWCSFLVSLVPENHSAVVFFKSSKISIYSPVCPRINRKTLNRMIPSAHTGLVVCSIQEFIRLHENAIKHEYWKSHKWSTNIFNKKKNTPPAVVRSDLQSNGRWTYMKILFHTCHSLFCPFYPSFCPQSPISLYTFPGFWILDQLFHENFK